MHFGMLFSDEQVMGILQGKIRSTKRKLKPQPVYLEFVGVPDPVWSWSPSKRRTLWQYGQADALELPELAKVAPLIPGDVIELRESWMYVRSEPNGDIVIRYRDGDERIYSREGKRFIQPPLGKWMSVRRMYKWIARGSIRITQTECKRANLDAPWFWHYEFEVTPAK